MLIDWFTVGAQVINFLLLVWLLKRFLYRPVLAAIDAREKRIATELAEAAQREAQARTEREEFERRNADFAQARDALLREATAAATAERERLMEAARQDSQSLRAKLNDVIANERNELSRRLSIQMQTEVFALTRMALTDLAGVELEERMVEVFIDRVRALPESQRELLRSAAAGAPARNPRTALVRSAFELALVTRTRIKAVVTETLLADLPLRFEKVPGLVCGIELTLEGVKLAWSVTDYLTSMAASVMTLVTPSVTAATPQPEARHA
jgi:F-type H+-transporting ATPase subunit b